MLKTIFVKYFILSVCILGNQIVLVKKALSNPNKPPSIQLLNPKKSWEGLFLEPVEIAPKSDPPVLPAQPEQVQTTTEVPLSLTEAIAIAEANNRDLRTARLQQNKNEAALTQAIAQRYPNLSLQSEGRRQQDAGGDISADRSREQIEQQIEAGETNNLLIETQIQEIDAQIEQPINLNDQAQIQQRTGLIVQRQQLEQQRGQQQQQISIAQSQLNDTDNFATTSITGSVNLNYALYSPGRGPSIRIAREQLRISELEVDRITKEVFLNTALAYYDLQQANQEVNIALADVEDRTSRLRDLERLLGAALATRLDLLNAQVERDNAIQILRNTQAQQAIARRNLAQILSLPASIAPVAQANVEVAQDWDLSLEQSIVLAFDNRVELEQQLAQRRVGQASRRLAKADLLPRLDLSANYNAVKLYSDDPSDLALRGEGDGYSLGASISWSLYDGGASSAKARQAEADIAIADEQFAQAAENIRFQVEQAFFQLPANRANVNTANDAVRRAREAVEAAQMRFQGGINSQTEVLDAQNRLIQAENNRIQAIINYNRALVTVQRAVGVEPELE